MRKSVSAGIAVAMTALAIVAVGPALPASAAPASCGVTIAGDPGTPSPNAQLATSTTIAHVGETIELSGAKYQPNEDVTLYVTGTMTKCKPNTFANGIKVGTAHTDASGSFDPAVVVPNVSGNVTIYGIGASLLGYDYATQPLRIIAAGGSSGGTGQPPAHTGVDIALMLAAGGLLIGAGVVFTRGGKRRRASAHI